jgi:predicted kinase
MAKLLMMIGLPASGKTTKVKELIEASGDYVRVNGDLLRTMLHFDKFTSKNEGITQDVQNALVRFLLRKGISVIVDNTNLGDTHRQRWSGIAQECGATFETMKLTAVPVDECLTRDAAREKSVGRDVILNMALRYRLYPLAEKSIVLCDLDGTLANVEHRRHLVQQEPADWEGFFAAIKDDTVRPEVLSRLTEYSQQGLTIVLISARPQRYRVPTLEWLDRHHIPYLTLLMRPDADTRSDADVKRDLLTIYFDPKQIYQVIDDRPVVIRMWKEQGIDVWDMGNGEEF